MAEITKRKLIGLLSFLASLLVTWLTGATSSAKEHGQGWPSSAEHSSWQMAKARLELSTSSLLPPDASLEAAGLPVGLMHSEDEKIVVAAYESGSPSSQAGSGIKPIPMDLYVPKNNGDFVPTAENERLTLERFMNIRVRIKKEAKKCETRAKREGSPYLCISEVLEEFATRLEREADRGSSMAKSALPIVRQMAVEVREAKSEEEALAAVQRGIGKVQQIRAVRSQDIVIANRQRQQRAVLTDTLQAVEVSLVKAISI